MKTFWGEVPVADALLLFNNEVFTTFDLRPSLPKIAAPTLVITGERDFITGPSYLEPSGIACSRAVRDRLEDPRSVEELPPQPVRGLAEPISIFAPKDEA